LPNAVNQPPLLARKRTVRIRKLEQFHYIENKCIELLKFNHVKEMCKQASMDYTSQVR
jgi:hypothetical protein